MENRMRANAVTQAIRFFGGVTKAVQATGFSDASWHRWQKVGRITLASRAIVVARLTGIPVERLAGQR